MAEVGVASPRRITVSLFFFRFLISSWGQRWQCPQSWAFWHPRGFQNQAHGLQLPVPCKMDPWLGVPGGATSPGGESKLDPERLLATLGVDAPSARDVSLKGAALGGGLSCDNAASPQPIAVAGRLMFLDTLLPLVGNAASREADILAQRLP